MIAIVEKIAVSVSSGTTILRSTPAAGASTSRLTFSVSIWTIASPFATWSP
jgi:hypothetical protein